MSYIINYPNEKKIEIPQKNIDSWYDVNGDNNVFIVNKIYNGRKNSVWEWDAIKFFMERLAKTPNAIVLDVGAQQGLYSLLAKIYPETIWHCFEPYKFSYELLNSNLKHNDIKNATTYQTALSNVKGNDVLFVPREKGRRGGLNCLAKNTNGRINLSSCDKINVKTETIDNLFINTPINYIKIDIEGFELNVLMGGVNTIKKYRPYVLMEYSPINMKTCNINPGDVDAFFRNLNYKWIRVDAEERFYYPV